MAFPAIKHRLILTWMIVCFLFWIAGCRTFDFYAKTLKAPLPGNLEPPREMSMVSLPTYRVEAPDVLQIEVVKLIPRPPYRIDVYDLMMIRVDGTPPAAPINNYYLVDAEGVVDLGPEYGKIRIAGLTIDEATSVVTDWLKQILRAPFVSIQLAQTGGTEEINGTYLLQQDGIVNLRKYGVVNVSGMTLAEVQVAIEKHLEQYFDSPKVTVEVIGYNSETYTVIREDTNAGESVVRLPITGNETVLDAIGLVGGLARASSQRIWLARPAPGNMGCEQILPIDYLAITRDGATATNYQILPGDRIFIAEDQFVATYNFVYKVTVPIYQLFGVTELGTTLTRALQTTGRGFNRQRRGI